MESTPPGTTHLGADYSIVIPVRDEAETIGPLVEGIVDLSRSAAPGLCRIVIVDDGSVDGSWQEVRKLVDRFDVVQGIRFRRNFGKAMALSAGIKRSRGQVIITMDGDLQDDPAEIPAFLGAIDGGLDVVSGWKRERHDPPSKTLPSRLFNWFTAAVTGIPLHDFNCGFKAYRRETIAAVSLYGELHRYIPVLEHALGYRIGEIEVRHHARLHGRSKYGASRLLKGFVDLLAVLALTRYAHAPGHLIGGAGVVIVAAGVVIALLLLVLHLAGVVGGGFLAAALFAWLGLATGAVMLAQGLVAEIVIQGRERTTDPALIIAEEIGPAVEKAG